MRAARRLLGTTAAGIPNPGLRVPSKAFRGKIDDVPRVMPILHQLSTGAQRGTPRWVETAPLQHSELTQRARDASWLEITYPFSSDEELRDMYLLGALARAGRRIAVAVGGGIPDLR